MTLLRLPKMEIACEQVAYRGLREDMYSGLRRHDT